MAFLGVRGTGGQGLHKLTGYADVECGMTC